jgi:hypothetical protein
LQPISLAADIDPAVSDAVEAINANFEKLNSRIFTFLDYAIVGQKGDARRPQ